MHVWFNSVDMRRVSIKHESEKTLKCVHTFNVAFKYTLYTAKKWSNERRSDQISGLFWCRAYRKYKTYATQHSKVLFLRMFYDANRFVFSPISLFVQIWNFIFLYEIMRLIVCLHGNFWHLNWITLQVYMRLGFYYIWDQMIQPITSFNNANCYFRNYYNHIKISLISFRIFRFPLSISWHNHGIRMLYMA